MNDYKPQVKTVPKRRSDGVGYAPGQDAEKRIISAAMTLFADGGYNGASTRKIAAEAGVSIPAIPYYFGNKLGLYVACARVISESWAEGLRGELDVAREVLEARQRHRAQPALNGFLEGSLDHSLTYELAPLQRRFFVRVQADGESPALNVVRQAVLTPMVDLIRGLIALSWGRREDDVEVELATFAVTRILTAFGSATREVNVPATFHQVHEAPIEMVKQMFRRSVAAILERP